jgi:hypothetical protein
MTPVRHLRALRPLALATAAALTAGVPTARAGDALPLWGFVDGAGVAHVASERLDVRYRPVLGSMADDRVPGKTDRTGGLLTWLEIAPEVRALRPWLRQAAQAHGLDMMLLKALIAVESGFDASAVSPAGALGLMQIMPASGDRYATAAERRQPAELRLRDPRTNIFTGARMLADLLRRFERVDLALAAWNAGEGRVRRAGHRLPRIAETEAHVEMVLAVYWGLLQRQQAHRATELRIAAPR